MLDTTDRRDGSAYFLYHSIGQYDGKAQAMGRALSAFSMSWGRFDDGQWGYALGQRQRFIDFWRELIGAPAGTLTTAENVTTALASIIGALPDHTLRGKRVLIAADCFPSLHFLLSGLAELHGFTLDTVPLRKGAHWVSDDDVVARWGEDVGLALLTWVTSTASHRCDLDRLIAHGRKMGSMIGVDITQGIGLMAYDLGRFDADFTVSTSLKWLCGSPGAGILQLKPEWIARCAPRLRGWFSQEDIFSWDIDSFAYAGDIRRFDHGTPSILACAATVPSLEWHAAQDRAEMIAHNRTLCEAIIAGVDRLGLELASPREAERRGGSVMVRLPEVVDPEAVLEAFRRQAVHADRRDRILRLSPGAVTTMAGVERMLACLEAVEAA